MSANPAQKKGMGPIRQSQRWDRVQLDHCGEEWESSSHYRVVSCGSMTGGNGLVTQVRSGSNCLADCWQTGVWVMTGGECIDAECRLRITTSRQLVRETVEAG